MYHVATYVRMRLVCLKKGFFELQMYCIELVVLYKSFEVIFMVGFEHECSFLLL